jgi:hypothetical protein
MTSHLAAIVAQADVIVTVNLKDFPDVVLSRYGIEALHPDDFVADLSDLQPLRVFGAIRAIQSRLKNPPVNFDQYMEILLRQGLMASVSALRQLEMESD